MKNILITGTSSGIGAIIANHLTENGFNVIGTSRKGGTSNDNFKTLKLDVTNDESVKKLVEQALEIFGKIDVLINNAGMGIAGSVEDTPIENAKAQFETNYFGVVRMTQAVLPHMRAKNGGKIINIGSLMGLLGMPYQAHYAASKFAIEGFTQSLRHELVPFNIQATNICPGDFKSDFTKNRNTISTISTAYKSSFDSMMSMVHEDESNGDDPIKIAKLVRQLIQKQGELKVRYVIGKTEQTISVQLKRLIGDNLFERILKRVWKL